MPTSPPPGAERPAGTSVARELSIGDLARASGLSAKALRLYDTSGLLEPHRVDPFTGYRYYAPEQVEQARLIARLRGIGMGLARIQEICALPAADAARDLRSWWLQEQADARSRGVAVGSLLENLRSSTKETTMTATTPTHTASPEIAARSEKGEVRPTQQDAHLVTELPGGRTLLAVADGFHADDSLAQRTLDLLADGLRARFEVSADADPLTSLAEAWPRIEDMAPAHEEDGVALTAAVLDQDVLAVAHLGDVRVLLVHEGRIEPVTRDHTYVASLVAAGQLTTEEAATHPQRSTLNRALASGAPSDPDLLQRRLFPGDRVVLMSDGVYAAVPSAQVAAVLAAPDSSAVQTVDSLVDRTFAAGSPDNLSVVVAQLR
jgi:protein phosphatase